MPNLSEMTREQLMSMVERLASDAQRRVTLKVSAKGAISMYGLGRFPVTLYRGQWERVAEAIRSGALERFIAANADKLSVKGQV